MKRFAATAVAAATLGGSVVGFARPAAADPAADVQQLIDNAPAAIQTLVDGLQAAVDVYVGTDSAVATSAAIGDAVVQSGTVLVAGTEQFGALGLGLLLVNLSVQGTLHPYLSAIDDPSTAGGLVDPNALGYLLNRLPALLEAEQGTLARTLVLALQGNLIDPPLGFGPAVYGEGVVGSLQNLFAWAGGDEPDDLYTTPLESVFSTLGITSLVIGGALESQVTDLEAAVAPLFEALGPVTEPLIGVLEGL